MSAFSVLSDDVTLNIILKLEDDPRDWARIACVCTKFSSIIRSIFWKNKCFESVSTTVSDLLSTSATTPPSDPPATWTSLRKLCVCCPGLLHAGILLENSDFGLERELGPDENYQEIRSLSSTTTTTTTKAITHVADDEESHPPSSSNQHDCNSVSASSNSENCWSLFDDLYFDTIYDVSESQNEPMSTEVNLEEDVVKEGKDVSVCRKRKHTCRSIGTHLATGSWNLSREQGNKLLASRFRGDCLYICDWPGCVHTEEKRNYMLFRGVFKNFKRSRVWRTINDGNRSKIALDCAFCSCKETWDLHSAFCLRRVFGYHDDGEPVVRAYVCENGHVSGAWTDRPMYT